MRELTQQLVHKIRKAEIHTFIKKNWIKKDKNVLILIL